MANKKKGVTAYWWMEDVSLSTGAATGATNVFLSATGTMQFQKMDVKRKSDRGEIRDRSNNVAGEGYSNDGYEGTFTGVPSGATLAALKTVATLPQAGNVIMFTDANEVDIDPGNTHDTAWIIDDVDWGADIGKARELVFKFHRFADANVAKDAV